MVLTRTDENELLTALHAGVFEGNPWELFLNRLLARTEAELCSIAIRPVADAPWQRVTSVRRKGEGALRVQEAVHPSFDDMRPGRVYSIEDFISGPDFSARYMRVNWPHGSELGIALIRTGDDFSARDSSLLASLSPHLTIALHARSEMERERRRSAMAERGLSALRVGWLLLDERGRVLDCDAASAAMMAEGRIIRRSGSGRLRTGYPEAEALLEKVMAIRADGWAAEAAWLSVEPPIQMAVMPPPDDGGRWLMRPHCLITHRGLPSDGDDGAFLTKLFRLTRGEAALAMEVATGASIQEAAETLGYTLETARNYSKRIYGKTGARGQADLVRIILNGVSAGR